MSNENEIIIKMHHIKYRKKSGLS